MSRIGNLPVEIPEKVKIEFSHGTLKVEGPKGKLEQAVRDGIDFEPYSEFLPESETKEWFKAWTGNDQADGSTFKIFGQDGSGGYAAFWLVDTSKPILDQPVVFLGSEGETGVIASNFDTYLWLLASGVGPYEAVAYPTIEMSENQEFLAFARSHSKFEKMSREEVLKSAQSDHSGFTELIESLCK